jgi:cytochrome c-L
VLWGKLLRIDVDTDAIADGKKLCTSNCIVCHGADGTGKMGPTIVGKDVVYKQVLTDPGMFAIIYGGANGAMQSFHRRRMMKCSGSSPM